MRRNETMRDERGTPIRGALAAAVSVLTVSGCVAAPTSGLAGEGQQVLADSAVQRLVDQVPHETLAALPDARLAAGLVPPTNRWFSGLVYGEHPQPVFPLPLSFALSDDGFEFGVPTVTTGDELIAGGLASHVSVGVADGASVSAEVSAYDAASVTISLSAGDDELGRVVLAQGSPLVSYTASSDQQLALGGDWRAVDDAETPAWGARIAEKTYGLTGGSLEAGDSNRLSLDAGETAVWFAVPDGGSVAELTRHAHPVESVTVRWSAGGTTTLDYATATSGDETLIATMPHQRDDLASPQECGLGSYPSIYGRLDLCRGSSLSWAAPARAPGASLDLSTLTADQRGRLLDQLAADVEADVPLPSDTYFGGKALARLANLLTVARQLQAPQAGELQQQLADALTEWTEPGGCVDREARCFVYDPEGRGLVGQTPSFGSDEFNDHHFHYGYFLYAAAVAAAGDPGLVEALEPVMTLLAADIGSGGGTLFPARRAYDAYAGHSWASGTAPFADGNNQESSSEAVNAWNGLALWAAVAGDTALEEHARWMLAGETASALAYWTDFDRDDEVYDGYGASIASLNWGGKREYNTWFSPEPNAKLAILLLPVTPVSEYLADDPERVLENLAAGAPSGYGVQFGDVMLMYRSLASPQEAREALEVAGELPDSSIDDGNSRTWLLAWIMAHAG